MSLLSADRDVQPYRALQPLTHAQILDLHFRGDVAEMGDVERVDHRAVSFLCHRRVERVVNRPAGGAAVGSPADQADRFLGAERFHRQMFRQVGHHLRGLLGPDPESLVAGKRGVGFRQRMSGSDVFFFDQGVGFREGGALRKAGFDQDGRIRIKIRIRIKMKIKFGDWLWVIGEKNEN